MDIGELLGYWRVTLILESYVDIMESYVDIGQLRGYWRVTWILESYVDIGELRGYWRVTWIFILYHKKLLNKTVFNCFKGSVGVISSL